MITATFSNTKPWITALIMNIKSTVLITPLAWITTFMPYRYRFSNPPRSPALPAKPFVGKWLTSFPSAAHMSCGDSDRMHTV